MMEDLFRVGVVSSTHGLKGEVKVFPTTDDVKRFSTLKKCKLDTGVGFLDLEIQNVKFFKQFAILKFKGIDNINDIEKYRGKDLWITRENAIPLEEDEYFIADLIGLKVYTDEDNYFGELKDIIKTGANDVYVVTTTDQKEVLLPATKECILDIDLSKKQIIVHILKGLLEL